MKNDIETAEAFVNRRWLNGDDSFAKILVAYADQFIPKWISVEDGEIKDGSYITVWHGATHKNVVTQAVYDKEKGGWYVPQTRMDLITISHYMSLPKPPQP
jgi:hypothetical protein